MSIVSLASIDSLAPPQWPLYATCAVLLVALVCSVIDRMRWQRAISAEIADNAHLTRTLLEKLSHIETNLTRIESAANTTVARVTAFGSRLEENPRSTAPAGAAGYGIAIRMARSGATRDELIATTGLSQQEADLVIRLHGQVTHDHGIAA